jgi:hypothetical protein
MSTTAKLKQAFIKQAHEQSTMITLAIFVKELEDELEVAQWIYDNYAKDYAEHMQMHMANMLEAQLKLNAGSAVVMDTLLKHVTDLAGAGELDITQHITNADTQAKQATDALLSKLRLH